MIPSRADPLPRDLGAVTLRRLAVGDLAAFQAYRRDPKLGRYQGWLPTSDPEALDFLAAMSLAPLFRPGAWSQIAIAEPAGLTLIGDLGLHLAADSRHVEIGFTLRRSSHGLGLASTAVRGAIQLAFEHTVAQRILGITDARNSPSVRLLERVGLRRIETRSAVFRGEPCTELVFALERGDDALQPV